MLDWLVYEEHPERPVDLQKELKAGFQNELDALQYRDWLRNIAIAEGYKIRYVVKHKEG